MELKEVTGLRPWKLKDDSPAAPKQGNKVMSKRSQTAITSMRSNNFHAACCDNFQAVKDRDNYLKLKIKKKI
jgi:hypothetical protein